MAHITALPEPGTATSEGEGRASVAAKPKGAVATEIRALAYSLLEAHESEGVAYRDAVRLALEIEDDNPRIAIRAHRLLSFYVAEWALRAGFVDDELVPLLNALMAFIESFGDAYNLFVNGHWFTRDETPRAPGDPAIRAIVEQLEAWQHPWLARAEAQSYSILAPDGLDALEVDAESRIILEIRADGQPNLLKVCPVPWAFDAVLAAIDAGAVQPEDGGVPLARLRATLAQLARHQHNVEAACAHITPADEWACGFRESMRAYAPDGRGGCTCPACRDAAASSVLSQAGAEG